MKHTWFDFAALMLSVVLALAAPAVSAGSAADDAFTQGLASFEQGDYELAIPRLNEAIVLDPLYARAHQYLGRALLRMGRWVEAVERLARAYDLMPEAEKRRFWSELWNSIVQALAALLDTGEIDQAIVVVRDAFEFSRQDAAARDQLWALLVEYTPELLRSGKFENIFDIMQQPPDYGI